MNNLSKNSEVFKNKENVLQYIPIFIIIKIYFYILKSYKDWIKILKQMRKI